MDLKSLFPTLGGSITLPTGSATISERELLHVFGLLRRPQYRGPTPPRTPRAHPARFAVHERGLLSKAFRNYAVRYMTKGAIRAARAEFEREATIAVRSGDTPLAERLTSKSATYPW